MKIGKLPLLLSIILAFLVVGLSSCNDDNNDNSTDPLVGIYTFSSATLSDDIEVDGNVALPAGTDFTALISSALLGSANCNDPADSRVELREDGTIWFFCAGDEGSAQQNGTWEVNGSRTQLTLTINISITPGAPATPFPLGLDDLDETNGIKGNVEGIPLPVATLLGPFFPDADFGDNSNILVNVDIEFDSAS
ncbi:MAG TPA: hypothetical protein DDY13_14980 [Cytophagales bacterium]|jgi:hypothetical protein|nr:hypothetical protein [Cytophagales bacterium]